MIYHSKLVYFLSIYTKMINNSKNNFYDCASSSSKSDGDVEGCEVQRALAIMSFVCQWVVFSSAYVYVFVEDLRNIKKTVYIVLYYPVPSPRL